MMAECLHEGDLPYFGVRLGYPLRTMTWCSLVQDLAVLAPGRGGRATCAFYQLG